MTSTRSTTGCLACALVLTQASWGQTFIVDASNGPGTHYLDLPQAIAAVPSGAVLSVRAGSYSPCAIAGKSLSRCRSSGTHGMQ